VAWWAHHACKNAPAMREALGDPDADLLRFPVGIWGMDLPSNVVFEVGAEQPCDVCGVHCRIWCEWVGAQIWVPA
jgi:hypothetical protein